MLHLVVLVIPLALAAPLPNEPIQPVPQTLRQDPARAEIGARLFTDSRLSSNGRMACASCHNLAKGGADGNRYALGVRGQPTLTNVPTVLNAALNFRQSWNGRAGSLEAQIDDVMQNPDELGATWDHVLRTVASDGVYRSSFAAAYKDGVTRENIRDALASYQRTLITPNSRFDRYLLGDADAITPAEKAGYAKFKQYGCVACHQGVNVGGNMYQKFGVMGNYFARRGNLSDADLGRFLVTKLEADKHVFKVPSLRNVARTAPYFHDGSVATLEEAVAVMFRYQLGRVATPEDRSAIVLFLNTLNGEVGEAR